MTRINDLKTKQIPAELMKRGYTPALATRVAETVQAQREVLRVKRIKTKAVRSAWSPLLRSLRRELANARVGRAWRVDDPERVECFDAYIAVLERLNVRLTNYERIAQHTPKQQAQLTQTGIPNNGEHWVDWVPERIKNALVQAFAELPHITRAKRKVPFQRVLEPRVFKRHRERLLTAIAKEREGVLATLDALAPRRAQAGNDHLEGNEWDKWDARLARLNKAEHLLKNAQANTALPPTWHGLVNR